MKKTCSIEARVSQRESTLKILHHKEKYNYNESNK